MNWVVLYIYIRFLIGTKLVKAQQKFSMDVWGRKWQIIWLKGYPFEGVTIWCDIKMFDAEP